MKIVVPYTHLHPITAKTPGAEFVDVSQSIYAYWELFVGLWKAHEDFCLIEHDIEASQAKLDEIDACPEPLCAFGYVPKNDFILHQMIYAFGFTRFRKELMEKFPAMPWMPNTFYPACPHPWGGMDNKLLGNLANLGVTIHRHSMVPHHHDWWRKAQGPIYFDGGY